MNEEKGSGEEGRNAAQDSADDKKKSDSASRARNRTVMLTPEMTGQVRALLQDAAEEESFEKATSKRSDPLEDFLPPLTDWDRDASTDRGSADEAPFAASEQEQVGEVDALGFGQRPAQEQYETENPQAKEEVGFNPLTSLAPPVDGSQRSSRGGGTGVFADLQPESEPEVDPEQAVQPLFSVNPSAGAAGGDLSANTRAPRTPVEAVGRIAPVSTAASKARIVGFLVSFDKDTNGEVYEVRSGRWLLTSRPTDHGDYILIHDETISPLHAIVRATKDGKIQILDQLSEYGTGLIRIGEEEEIEVAGGLETVNHGDTIRFGERCFVLCTVPKVAETEVAEEE